MNNRNRTDLKDKRPFVKRKSFIVGLIVITMHTLGVISSVNALMSSRTAPGTVAWIVSLNTMPYVSVPAYWLFGSPKFQGYVSAMREKDSELGLSLREKNYNIYPFIYENNSSRIKTNLEKLSKMPVLGRNSLELLIDGEKTFDCIFEGIGKAENYILVQFYIVESDSLGNALKDLLIKKSLEGVRVYFIYDAIGSRKLPSSYIREMQDSGINVGRFRSSRSLIRQFQINFRNHRKIVVTDGKKGWIGGFNVADRYISGNPKLGSWRDTHLKIEGPAALALQVSFMEDWYWITDTIPELSWEPVPSETDDIPVIVIPSGPADDFETASLMMQSLINKAEERIWITSPYFVPDEGVMGALKLAGLRGVDVRIIIPQKPDLFLVYYAAYAFLGPMIDTNIKIYRYMDGFLHSKTFLVDGDISGVGTVNLDNRSFRLNFEITAVMKDSIFTQEMSDMFENDFRRSRLMTKDDIESKSFWRKVLSRAAYMTAPLL